MAARPGRQGATIVSICEGARVLANAGLLHDRRATTHWSALKGLTKAYPDTTWVRDRRYVQDGAVISTTGVSASIPASLALVEAIAGRAAPRPPPTGSACASGALSIARPTSR
uniref:DJ-1/PfpI family protein n=1 Tax=Phenylobacterium glaciei TaxID=2803784 RepID=A0A974SAQ9_9CAUL|nr:DJ-1/PfpI family protein [Phenylobacterium glaciei]